MHRRLFLLAVVGLTALSSLDGGLHWSHGLFAGL